MSTLTNTIPIVVKRECVRLQTEEDWAYRKIYDEYYTKQIETPCTFVAFRRSVQKWKRKIYPDPLTLEAGTYEGFTAHNATVQVNNQGQIIQAWIKQKSDDFDPEEFLEALRGSIEPYIYERKNDETADRMLEIPLFDMHWGVCDFSYYQQTLNDILELVTSRHWDKIVIPLGQDFFHNDSIVNPTTTKGTVVDKVDMTTAVKEGRRFITAIIDESLRCSNSVRVLYTPGNHDRSICWMFMQVLLERYGPEIVDDSMEYRKVFTYGKNSIMVTHGDSKQATTKNLAHIFPIVFPEEFAQADIREVHAGHLHHESEGDIYGVMIRRLSSRVAVDDWSNRQDFVGAHRRFMVFEWDRNSLRSVHYI